MKTFYNHMSVTIIYQKILSSQIEVMLFRQEMNHLFQEKEKWNVIQGMIKVHKLCQQKLLGNSLNRESTSFFW